MHSDAYFTIGKAHRVCQDYARAGTLPDGNAYAILSDGCSSSPDTDFGSRLLTLAAESSLRKADALTWRELIQRAEAQVVSPLPQECLDATLLMAVAGPDGVGVKVAGDGLVVALRRDGSVEVFDIDFQGAPGYLSYILNPARWDNYTRLGYGTRTVTRTHGVFQPTGFVLTNNETTLEPTDLSTLVWGEQFLKADYAAVFIFSDGAKSFQRETKLGFETIPVLEVLPNLVNIKSATGSFVIRRCQNFKSKHCRDNKWHHDDDLAVASIWMDD